MVAIPDNYFEYVFSTLSPLKVTLDADPLAAGPKRLNGKVKLSRDALDKVEAIFSEVVQYLSRSKHALLKVRSDFNLQKDALISNDAEIRSGASFKDREALVSSRLKKEVEQIQELESQVSLLEDVLMVVKAKRTDLRDTRAALREQVALCKAELGLGDKWANGGTTGKDPIADVEKQKAEQKLESLLLSSGNTQREPLAEVSSLDEVLGALVDL